MKITKRKFVQSLGCSGAVALSTGCLGQISPGNDDTADSTEQTSEMTTAQTTISTTPDKSAGLVITNNTESSQTVSVTVTALESDKTVFEKSVSLGTESEKWNKSFSDIFTEYGKYEVHAETEAGDSKTKTATYEQNQWEYWNVRVTSSGIKMNGVFQ